jgi:hypothetical protein
VNPRCDPGGLRIIHTPVTSCAGAGAESAFVAPACWSAGCAGDCAQSEFEKESAAMTATVE